MPVAFSQYAEMLESDPETPVGMFLRLVGDRR